MSMNRHTLYGSNQPNSNTNMYAVLASNFTVTKVIKSFSNPLLLPQHTMWFNFLHIQSYVFRLKMIHREVNADASFLWLLSYNITVSSC